MQTGPHTEGNPCASKVDNGNVTIYSRGFNVTWGNDNRYWNITDEVAELKQVSWLEVTCSTNKVEDGKEYSVGFNVTLRPDAFGWKEVDVYVMAKVGKKGKFSTRKVSLGDQESDKNLVIPDPCEPLKITVSKAEDKIYVGLYEVWSKKWKGGLKIHDAFIHKQ